MISQPTDYQIYAFNKLLKHDKSFIIWPRQCGKSYLLYLYLENFVNNNQNKNILFFSDRRMLSDFSKNNILRELNSLITKISGYDIYFVNNNHLRLCINYDDLQLAPSLILYDDFYSLKFDKVSILDNYIRSSNCKCIFTLSISVQLVLFVVKEFDKNNDYYFNVLYQDKIKELSYKPNGLIDYYGYIAYQRKLKLERLNKISNGS